MIALNAHFDGKVFVPDEPLNLPPNAKIRITVEEIDAAQGVSTKFSPFTDITATFINGETWDESAALHVDPLEAIPKDFVRRAGTAAGSTQNVG